MNFDIKRVKIFVMVPAQNAIQLRHAMCKAGAGVIGEYYCCTSSTKVLSTFIPTPKANPYIGEKNKLEVLEEEKLEAICNIDKVKSVINAIRSIHPYEEPAIDIVPLLDENEF